MPAIYTPVVQVKAGEVCKSYSPYIYFLGNLGRYTYKQVLSGVVAEFVAPQTHKKFWGNLGRLGKNLGRSTNSYF